MKLNELVEGFQDDQVRAFVGDCRKLLGEGLGHFLCQVRLVGLIGVEARPDGRGHQDIIPGGLAGQADAGAVDRLDLVSQAEGGEFHAVCAEGVGLDHIRPGLDVLLVDRQDEFRPGQAKLVVAGVDEHASLIDHRPHRAVEYKRHASDAFEESGFGCHVVSIAFRQRNSIPEIRRQQRWPDACSSTGLARIA